MTNKRVPSPARHELGVLDQVLVFRLRRIRDRLAEPLRRSSIEGGGLRAGEFGALALIDANSGISQIELARAGGFDQTLLVGILDDLEARGWALRTRDSADRRRHIVAMTKKGRVALGELLAMVRESEATARNALSAKEYATFQTSLDKIYRALF
jgi:DNA-binding MarR family transcriptional regulator